MAQKVRTAVLLSAVVAAVAAATGGAAASEQRGYEQVSPADKTASVLNAAFSQDVHVTDDGESVFYPSTTALPGGTTGLVGYYRADRGLAAWATTPLVPVDPARAGSGGQTMLFVWDVSPSGGSVVYSTRQSLDPADTDVQPGSGAGGEDLYLQRPDGSYTWISHNELNPNDWFNRYFDPMASADDSHVVFMSMLPLLAADSGRDLSSGGDARGLYDWHGGVLQVVAADDSGNLVETGDVTLGDGRFDSNHLEQFGTNPISTDGSRIFFSTVNHVYVRDHGLIHSVAPGATPSGVQTFQGATPDGSKAFFTTDDQLTPDDTDSSVDLYAFDVSSGAVHRVSTGATDAAAGAGVMNQGVRVSDDGRIVYFVTSGGLGGDSAAPAGRLNLYVSVDGAIRRVTTVAADDFNKGPIATTGTADAPVRSNWYATPDGQHLVFATKAPVTADDRDSKVDVFEFSLATSHVVRVSAGETGGNGSFDTLLGLNPGDTSFAQWSGRQPNVVSDDGRYIVFQTDEALADRDSNGLQDVYLYDAADDSTQLISGGTDDRTSDFLGMGRSGRDVLFATFQSLVPQDGDRFKDIYDARIGGGYPVPPAAPVCRDDDCQGPASASPPDQGVPGSATLHGSSAVDSTPPRPAATRLAIVRPTAATLRRAAKTGSLTLSVRVNRAGILRLLAKSVLTGRTATSVGRRSVSVRRAGTVHVTIHLSSAARRALGRRSLRVVLEASLPPGHSTRRLTVTLRRTSSASTARSAHPSTASTTGN